jgi:hypothetical protein
MDRFHRFAEQDDGVAFVLEPLRGDVLGLLDQRPTTETVGVGSIGPGGVDCRASNCRR